MENVVFRPRLKREKGYDGLIKVHKWLKDTGKSVTVYPGLGLTSSEIKARIKNRSFIPNANGLGFNADAKITELQGLSIIDLMRSHANEKPKLEKLAKAVKDGKK